MLHDMSKLEFGALIAATVRFIYKSILLGQKKSVDLLFYWLIYQLPINICRRFVSYFIHEIYTEAYAVIHYIDDYYGKQTARERQWQDGSSVMNLR